jgi:hypothetical protein
MSALNCCRCCLDQSSGHRAPPPPSPGRAPPPRAAPRLHAGTRRPSQRLAACDSCASSVWLNTPCLAAATGSPPRAGRAGILEGLGGHHHSGSGRRGKEGGRRGGAGSSSRGAAGNTRAAAGSGKGHRGLSRPKGQKQTISHGVSCHSRNPRRHELESLPSCYPFSTLCSEAELAGAVLELLPSREFLLDESIPCPFTADLPITDYSNASQRRLPVSMARSCAAAGGRLPTHTAPDLLVAAASRPLTCRAQSCRR